MHVAAPERREELHVRHPGERRSCAQRGVGALGERAPAEHDNDRSLALAQDGRGGVDRIVVARTGSRGTGLHCGHQPFGDGTGFAGTGAKGDRRRAQRCIGDREVDDRHAEVDRGPAHAQVENRQLFLQIGTEEHDRGGAVAVADLGARKPEHDLGREAVAELRVDVIGAEHALGEPGPHVRVLVASPRATEHRDRSRAVEIAHALERGSRGIERLGPGGLDELAAAADQRFDDARLGVDVLEPVAALVAQPTVVDRLGVDTEETHEPIGRRLQRAAALHRARGARRLDGREIPRAGAEAVRLRRERTDRADLHGVAREVRREGMVGEVEHLGAIATLDERDERVARDLVGETRAARALDAALAVEQHDLADRDRLLEVPLLLGEARLARAEGEGLILQRALAAAIAHGAVERMVDEQELEHAVLDLLHRVRLGAAHHAFGDRCGARGREAADAVDLDQAHPAHSDGLHALVPAEPRDVDPVLLRDLDQELTGLGRDLAPVDVDGDRVGLHVGSGISGGHAPIRSLISARKNLSRLTTAETALGPSGQIVV